MGLGRRQQDCALWGCVIQQRQELADGLKQREDLPFSFLSPLLHRWAHDAIPRRHFQALMCMCWGSASA